MTKKVITLVSFAITFASLLCFNAAFASSKSPESKSHLQTMSQGIRSGGEETSIDAIDADDLRWETLYEPSRAAGTTRYVNITTGDDSNPGTSELPWKTIHHALLVMDSGSVTNYNTLNIAAGTYSIGNEESDSALQLSQDYIKIVGAGDAAVGAGDPTVIIDGTGANNWTDGLVITGSNCTINGISITNFSGSGSEIADGYGILITGEVSGNEVTNCNLYENVTGIEVRYSANINVTHCKIHGNTSDGLNYQSSSGKAYRNAVYQNNNDGIGIFNCSPDISRNKIYDNNVGVRVEVSSEVSTASPLISNNVIFETTNYSMLYGIRLEFFYGIMNPRIFHNTIDAGSGDGISLYAFSTTSTGTQIKYNIITHCDSHGISIAPSITGCTIDYNDVWHNGPNGAGTKADNYDGCDPGTHDLYGTTPGDGLGKDPQYNNDLSLQSTSPCINTIPETEADPVTIDYAGFSRPRPNETAKDMGAFEYVAKTTVAYTLPGGTGLATDYRIFTIPLKLGTGGDMLKAMENVLGPYNPVHWRAFLYNGTDYIEFNSTQFASQSIVPGMGFWINTTYTDTIPFEGMPAPDGVDYVMDLAPGWHLIGLPWTETAIFLSSINVTDGVNTYAIISPNNDLTQRLLWDFTGDGPFSGYEKRTTAGFRLQNDKGYFFKVLSDQPVRLIIPNAANLAQGPPLDMAPDQANTNEDDEDPPPPPGPEPIPDIKANGQDGPVTVTAGESVSVSVSLDTGVWSGRNADWWVAAHTPFNQPLDWYTYVYPQGWQSGIHTCVQMPLLEMVNPVNVLDMVLPSGNYTFYFAVDGNMDGKADATWVDSVQVIVE